ncbi:MULTISPECIES: antitoxin Xre/MbcA/ParS toxin-binding domain-containing protein [unclassified Halomonas]|uniref:antitoxin Xre/MbcA/ParS toxin-binding domain-containing protein n=1 Tax=unclassified Halomonas TaxID=2609666 RepID=UPI0028882531|nr:MULTISPECIES: antitoxin Xre/MbcA/ParS toxin-binding domain-containing protein [unclassified Halomonas]MDT0501752.1 antitoxin Xre/MbcA/ParS toxin-binding domain-containing protein [Halomonas sp. PAR7]MDT0513418.1 antitoxin Xre/MbcA/ParS toxin-binding domain-containing protein [Halomonas sp. LES1]MDT0591815.1 antitoxin Xre/MbcA/ParS toxin-binding domain-containing protein [Halomonas sp. PAR8]
MISVAVSHDIERALLELLGGDSGSSANALIHDGIPLSALDRLNEFGLAPTEIGIVSSRALRQRRIQGKPLTLREGDCLYRVARLALQADVLFGSRQKALAWLHQRRHSLGGHSALHAAFTTLGLLAAEELLGQLKHGYCA